MTRFRELFGIEFPVVGFSHCRDVVAAVSNAGGLGVLGANTFTPEQLELELAWLDAHIDGRPYGVNVLSPPPTESEDEDLASLEAKIPEDYTQYVESLVKRFEIPPPKTDRVPMPFGDGGLIVSRRSLEQRIDIALAHPIKLLVAALGPFDPALVERAHGQGVAIGGMCGAAKHALAHTRARADVVIAQGNEAAGHTGDISTLVLVPQVVDAVAPTPVLAAGGVINGRQLAAVMALGAQGAWMGSVWLATRESDVDPMVIAKLIEADSSQTLRTRALTGKPVRILRTPFEAAWSEPDALEPLRSPLQGVLVKSAMAGIYENHVESLMGHTVGQGVGLMTARRPVRTVIDSLMKELVAAADALQDDLA